MTSRWSTLPLKDVIGFKKGKKPKVLFDTPIADGLPYLLIENFGKIATGYTNDKTCGMACEQDTLLVCDGARTGLASFGHRGYIGSTLAALSPDVSRILPEYLYYFIREKFTLLNSRTRGATIPHLDRELLFGLNIPLPQLDEQRRIVDLLSRADGIVRLRREAENKAAEIIPALFMEMFGDPATNPKGWPVSTLGKVVHEFRYGTSQKSGPAGLPVLRIPNVIGNQLKLSEMKLVDVPKAEIDRLRLLDGDFLFVRTNGNPDYVGRSAVFNSGVMTQAGFDGSNTLYASYLIRARIQQDKLNPYFLQGMLTSSEGRRTIKERSKTSAGQFNINTEGLGSIPIFLPPIAFQTDFVQRCHDVFSIQTQQVAATATAQATFDALLADAFKTV